MNKPAFTPGPWEINGLSIVAKSNGYRVADVPLPNRIFRGKEWHEERKYCKANAALIAAAPDMYEVLREAYVSLDCDESNAELCDKIKTILAKVQS